MLNGVWIFLCVRFPATWNKIGCGKKDENADENVDKNTDEKKPTERLVFLKVSANTELYLSLLWLSYRRFVIGGNIGACIATRSRLLTVIGDATFLGFAFLLTLFR